MLENKNLLRKKYQQNFKQALSKLNSQQKKAVETIEGPVVVVAGPGTGKTQILTLRIANIIQKLGADFASNILALTFTNSGVRAMRERLEKFIGTELAYKVGIYTFHSFAEEQIKKYPDWFSRFQEGRPISEVEKIQIIEKILKEGEYEKLKSFADSFSFYIPRILQAIADLKAEGLSPSDFEKTFSGIKERIIEKEESNGRSAYLKRASGNRQKGDLKKAIEIKIKEQQEKQKELKDIYGKYQKLLIEKKLYDFEDTILAVVKEAENNTDFQQILQEQYLYILVDEHQDTNEAQNKIIELIGEAAVNEGSSNIFTVGDAKQAIYRFQGANQESFLRFAKKYSNTQQIYLEENYRSSQVILDASHFLLPEKKLKARHSQWSNLKEKIKVGEFLDRSAELLYLAEDIAKKIKRGIKPSEIAVFYRQNRELNEIKGILTKKQIPFAVYSKENILNNKEIRKAINFLEAINNPFNDEIMAKILWTDFLNLNVLDVMKILERLRVRGQYEIENKSIFKIISSPQWLEKIEITSPGKFLALAKFISQMKTESENREFPEFFELFLRESGWLNHLLRSDNSIAALNILEKIFNEIKKEAEQKKDYRLSDFLYYLNTLEKYGQGIETDINDLVEGVALMTAHKAKGLEFEYVYIVNFVRNFWGKSKQRGDTFILPVKKVEGNLDDERRLFYVALTRAKKEAQILYAHSNFMGQETEASQFLSELNKKHWEKIKINEKKLTERAKEIFLVSSVKKRLIFNQEFIEKLFLSKPLSVSALNNYFRSPLVYFFRNLLALPSMQSKHLLYGNIMHTALEKIFQASQEKGSLISSQARLKLWKKSLNSYRVPEEMWLDINKKGKETLKKYFQHYQSSFNWKQKIYLEKSFISSFKLPNKQNLRIYGIVDKIEEIDAHRWRVIDYKTGKIFSTKSKEERENLERQLIFYKFLIERSEDNRRVVETVLDFVEEDKRKGFERRIKKVTSEEVRQLEEEITIMTNDILSGDFLKREYERDKDNAEYFDLWESLKQRQRKQLTIFEK